MPRGFKARGVLTFQGPQGIGKTSWVMALVSDPEVKAGFARRDEYTVLNSPEAAAQFLRSEQERFARLVKKANVVLE